MNPAAFSVRRPVFTSMVALIVIIIGAASFIRLPIDLMPDITYPTLSIRTTYSDAAPEVIEELIAKPIEEAVAAVPGVEEVTSVSAEGAVDVRVSFSWGTNLDAAASDVRDRLDRVVPHLPDEADRPTLRKYDLASFPVLLLGAAADLDPIQLRRIIDDQVVYRFERIPGVAAVNINGGRDREIQVRLKADKVQALGLQLDKILERVRAGNVTLPGGVIDQGPLSLAVRTKGEYISLDDLAETAIAVRQGAIVRLKDVADLVDGWEDTKRVVWIDGRPGVRLVIYKQSGTNTVEVAERVMAEVERIKEDLPQINLTVIIDTAKYVKRSVTNLGQSALYGGALAIFVILLFLRSIGSTMIMATSIPISIMAAFALMYFGGFTLNIMTLGGLALGVGMLVDNAIVVLENISRLHETGRKPEEAAIRGAGQVGAAIVASTLTTLTVFLPLIFVQGMAGVMFKQLSYVVAFSLLCSLAVAMTLTPMLAKKSLVWRERRSGRGKGPVQSLNGGGLKGGLADSYADLLNWSLRHRFLVIVFCLSLLGGSLYLGLFVGAELMPQADESEVRVYAEMAVGTRIEILEEKFRQIHDIVKKEVPERVSDMAFLGGTSWRPSGTHTGQLRIALVPASERTRSSDRIAAELRRQLSVVPGVMIRTRPGRGLFIMRMGFGGDERLQAEVRGHDLAAASAMANQIKAMAESLKGVTDAQLSVDTGRPERLIKIDRIRAADLGVTVSQAAQALQTALSGSTAGQFRSGGKEYPIRVMIDKADKKPLDELLQMTLTNAFGEPVVLSNLTNVEQAEGPVRIQRRDQERVITISAEVSGRPLGEVLEEFKEALHNLPSRPDMSVVISGDYEDQQEAFTQLLFSLILALVLVYMVMACQFESLKHPLTVMLSVPFAAIGVIVTLFLTDTTINIQSFIGCIMLGGIVVNNAILLVDQANQLRDRGMPPKEAAAEAGRRRLRPILMTALTTILGLGPLALGLGEGSEAQAPMARAVIGGLASSTLITLLLTPTVYTLMEGRLKKTGPGEGEAGDSEVSDPEAIGPEAGEPKLVD